jgi:uncharacterized protein
MKFGLAPYQYKILNDLVVKPLQKADAKVWIFGSRATGKYREQSDVDILYEPSKDHQLPVGLIFKIKSDIEESNFPFKVDLVNKEEIAFSYKEQVEKDKVLIS